MNGNAAGQGLQGTPPGGTPPAGGFGGMLLGGPTTSVVVIALFAITLVVLAIVFYRVAAKAGMSPWLGLLTIVPGLGLIAAGHIAFAKWPKLEEVDRLKLVAAASVAATRSDVPGPEPALPLDAAEPTG